MTTVLESLNSGLQRAFSTDARVLLLGEDVLDPYGGAFKVTRGLSTAYPGRVIATPISEAGIVGLAAGIALRGLRPVVEIMFGDFLTLAADQLINHAAKFRWMYNDQARVPLVVRTPMGGRRGYGPTHSQTLEKHFLGTPGLEILAPCAVGDPGKLLSEAILTGEDPVLFIENKLSYLQSIHEPQSDTEFEITQIEAAQPAQGVPGARPTPVYLLRVHGAPPPVITLTCYGYMVDLARQAAQRLAFEQEVFVEIVAPTRLAPIETGAILTSARQTGRLIALEEGGVSFGWGAEVIARAAQALGPRLLAAERLGALDLPIPSSGPLEAQVLPDVERIMRISQKIV
ncbi:MAG: hypothetical protein B6D39_07060 [Anaerolineae bacterium UTCFX2]|jgi:pyruvate/2-oxoglutarate/acetoin dehydrogenase E1 component|nr:alpha-ketoacid dehydrogenase subunit beta [Anaerolineae bacterium]MCZ7552867.1 hypothetical protein [Anaerolineales bacterium]OQY91426.1 MAG: hypothetical protein B6D39_07060 [Anaerolineae bacterium UTCFX2]